MRFRFSYGSHGLESTLSSPPNFILPPLSWACKCPTRDQECCLSNFSAELSPGTQRGVEGVYQYPGTVVQPSPNFP